MAATERPLDNPINWSFRVGRLFDLDIRVHITFVICAVVLVAMEIPVGDDAPRPPLGTLLTYALGGYAILFLIVLLHEFGHCFGARYAGGDADEVLLWPLGGLAYTRPPHNPQAHMLTAVAGPMVNVIICAITSLTLLLWTGRAGAVPWNPFNPFGPVDPLIIPTTGQFWLIRIFGISYILLLFNLLPIFPFDGGRILQAWLWPRKGYFSSMYLSTGVGMVGAIPVGLLGLFTNSGWLLLMIAVFGYLTCWQQRRELREHGESGLGEFGYDFSRGYDSLNPDQPRPRRVGFLKRWRARRAAQREERERRRWEAHQQAVEQILLKVSHSGLGSLTPHERRILEQETERQRSLAGRPDDDEATF